MTPESLLSKKPNPETASTTSKTRKPIRRAALVLLGACISLFLCANAFFRIEIASRASGLPFSFSPRFPISSWASELPSHLPWVAAFAILTALIIPLRALQWRYTLGTGSPAFKHRYHAVAIGAFFHNAVPGKLGELARAFLLARRHAIPFFQSLGSVLVCKLLELAALVIIVSFAILSSTAGYASNLLLPILLAVAVCSGLITLVVIAARWAGPLGARIQQNRRETSKLARIGVWLSHLAQGLHAARSPARASLALLVSFGPVLASTIAYGVALRGLGIPAGLFAGGVILGAVSLGQITPGLPIGTGMYYLTSSWAARALGASAAQAAALTVLTHLAAVSSHLLVGAISLAVHRIGLRDLIKHKS